MIYFDIKTKKNKTINTTIESVIQIGERTQIQDHVATTPQPPNLRVTKIRVRIVARGKLDLFFILIEIIELFYHAIVGNPSDYLTILVLEVLKTVAE